ncbi:MAG: hypothetical protein WCL60_10040 [Methylococcales bacterium]
MPYPKFKLAILALLAIDVVIYAFVGTLTRFLDAFSWMLLLIIYEMESMEIVFISQAVVSLVRNSLIAVIGWVLLRYFLDNQWLDVTNSALWFVMIILFELKMRWPTIVQQYQPVYNVTNMAVLAGLGIVALIWLLDSAWLDAFDAVLWLVALVVIDLDVFKLEEHKQA